MNLNCAILYEKTRWKQFTALFYARIADPEVNNKTLVPVLCALKFKTATGCNFLSLAASKTLVICHLG